MPLMPAPLPIMFGGGVDLRTDSKQVPTTKMLDLVNVVFTKMFTISKRFGYRALSREIQDGGGDISGARGLGQRDGEVLAFTDKRCYSYRPTSDLWADTGEVAATAISTRPVARTGTLQTQPDIADRNGVRVVAWEDSRGGVWCEALEAATGRVLLAQTQLDAAALARNPRCMAVGEVLHVLWTREDTGQIRLALINPAHAAAVPMVTTLLDDLDAGKPYYDAQPATTAPGGSFVARPGLIAWAQAGGGFRVGYVAPAGVLGGPATSLPSVATYADVLTGPIAVTYNDAASLIAIAWVGGASVVNVRTTSSVIPGSGGLFAPAVATSTGYTRIALAFGANLAGGIVPLARLVWAAEVTAARSDLTLIDSGVINVGTGVAGAPTRLRGHGLVSRAFADGTATHSAGLTGDIYVMISHTARFFPYVAALRLTGDAGIAGPAATIISRVMPGEAAGALMRPTGPGTRAWTQHLPSVLDIGIYDAGSTELSARQHAVCVPYRIQLSSQNGDQFSEQGIKLAVLDFRPIYQTAQLGRNLYLGSSCPMAYDGDRWREADFHTAPDYGFNTAGAPVDMTTAITPVAGGNVANGGYVYAWWYEAVDAQGELHRGAPSVKMFVTMTGGPRSFSMAIPTCRLTKFLVMRICVARTEAGAIGTDTQLPLYRVTSNDVTITTGSNRYLLNDPSVDAVTFVDGLDDATIKTREPLYTNGGILPNAPAPWAGGVLAAGKSRLYWTDPTDPSLVRFSQQIADDTALEAPVELSMRKDPFGGAVTALGMLDDTVIVFSPTAVYVFAGPGPLSDPSAAPEANAFTAIERISTDVGCTTPTSVGETPVGLTFQSAKGIMMLTRERQIVNIGNDVQKFDQQLITHATLIPSAQRIVYLTDAGRTLMWDYNRVAWSTFTNHEGLDALVVDGLYYYLRTDGRVFVETPGEYRDDNTHIPMSIETAWIHFATYLQGWQRVLRAFFLGRYVSPHNLSVRYRLDYDESYSPPIIMDVNANFAPAMYGAGPYGAGAYGGGGGGGSRYQRGVHLNKRCQAISFLIQDIEETGDAGASFELSELLLIGGGIGPAFRVGAARSS